MESSKKNALMTITVDRDRDSGYWLFDDPARELVREALVMGADRILDEIRLDEAIVGPKIADKLILTFSAQKFPGSQYAFERKEPENGGYWYYWPQGNMRGWLCPALFLYFAEAPEVLHMSVKAHPDADVASLALIDVEAIRTLQVLERRLASESIMFPAEIRVWRDRIKLALVDVELI